MTEKKAPIMSLPSQIAVIAAAILIISVSFFAFTDRADPPVPPGQAVAESPHGPNMAMPGGMPEDYESLVRMGNSAMDNGNYAMAAEAYRRALEIDGGSLAVRTDFGACLHGMGLPDRALEELRKVLRQDPNHTIATFNMGIVFYSLNQTDSAVVHLNRCLDLDPGPELARRVNQLLADLKS